MILTMMNTHKAYKALQDAGVADKQAEVLVEIFADMQQENALTKFDLSQAMEGMARVQSATTHRLDSLDGRFDKFEKNVNQRFDKIDEKFIKIDEKFDKIDEKFDKIDQRFEKVDERLNKQDVKLNDLDQRMQIGFTELKQDNVWIRRILLTIATALIAMTTKYILSQ